MRAHVARVVIRPLPGPIPDEELEVVARIRESYDYYSHLSVEAEHGQLVSDALVDRFALAGAPEECAARLAALQGLVGQVALVPYVEPGASRADTMRLFAAAPVGA